MAYLYRNAQAGTITDNPLLIGGTTINSAAFANLPTIAGNDRMWLTLDPTAVAGAPEVVLITAHTAAATSVTVTRGQQSTTARQHLVGTIWRHTATQTDHEGGLLALATTKGDSLYATAVNTVARQAVGANDTVLIADSAQATGVKYATIAAANIANNAVTTAKILDANVTTAKILDANITTAKILDDNVTVAKIGGGAKGQLLTNTGADAATWLAAGTNGLGLVADSSVSPGVKWGYPAPALCQLVQSVATNVTNGGAGVTASFDLEDTDQLNWHSGGAPTRITPTIAGLYQATVAFDWQSDADYTRRYVEIAVNGAGFTGPPYRYDIGSSVVPTGVLLGSYVSPLFSLNGSSDYVEVIAFQTNTSTGTNTFRAKFLVQLVLPS